MSLAWVVRCKCRASTGCDMPVEMRQPGVTPTTARPVPKVECVSCGRVLDPRQGYWLRKPETVQPKKPYNLLKVS
jgi:hypothetical protein